MNDYSYVHAIVSTNTRNNYKKYCIDEDITMSDDVRKMIKERVKKYKELEEWKQQNNWGLK